MAQRTDTLVHEPRAGSTGAAARAHAEEIRWLPMLALALSLVATLSWWVNRPAGAGAVPLAIGQLTGLQASLWALITVVLLARVPYVANVVGTDRSVAWHRTAATITMLCLPVHVVATVLGYGASDALPVPSEIANLLSTYPDMITATVAAALFAAIGVTSMRWCRRRLAYPTWLFVHWYAYLAVALSFGHELSDGASFVHATVPTMVWTWLHLAVGGTVLWYRVALPAWRMARHPLVVSARTPEGPGVTSIELAGRHLDDYEPVAGQHVRVRFLTRTGWWQSHPLSLSAVPSADRWRLTVADRGDHTHEMQRMPVGTRALVSGVFGHLRADERTCDRVLLIAGGDGITPLRALLEAFPKGVDVRLLYRAHAEEQLILRDEIDRLMFRRGTEADYVVGPRHPDPARDALSPGWLVGRVPDLLDRDVYLCGHRSFVEAVERSLHTLGLDPARLHSERFDT